MASGQKGQDSFSVFFLLFPKLTWTWRRGASKNERQEYCNHAPPVGFIKFSYFTHSQACCKRARGCTFPPNTRFFPHSGLWWNRSCHAVTVCGRRTNKCSSPGSCDLNGKATWQFDSERPHNQTPHPQLSTSASGQEAVLALPVQHTVPDPFHPPKIPFICRVFLFPLLK